MNVNLSDGWEPVEPEPSRASSVGWLLAFVLIVAGSVAAVLMVRSEPKQPQPTDDPGGNGAAATHTNTSAVPVAGQPDDGNDNANGNSGPPPDLFPPPGPGYQPSVPGAKHVLFVGNSYTMSFGLPDLVKQIAASGPDPVVLDVAMTADGQTFADHMAAPMYRGMLRNFGPWDYVVLQGQSVEGAGALPELRERFVAAGLACAKQAMEAGAQVIWFATWPRRADHPFYQENLHPIGRTPDEMLHYINTSYSALHAATALQGARVAWVGKAWMTALGSAAGTEPPLDLNLYDGDGSHPTPIGAWLAALVIAQTITGTRATDFTFTPPEVPGPVATLLRAAAATASD